MRHDANRHVFPPLIYSTWDYDGISWEIMFRILPTMTFNDHWIIIS